VAFKDFCWYGDLFQREPILIFGIFGADFSIFFGVFPVSVLFFLNYFV